MMTTRSTSKPSGEGADETPVRQRILDAAFSAFMASGYAETSTLEIATRAHVSKRELCGLVGRLAIAQAVRAGGRPRIEHHWRRDEPCCVARDHDPGSVIQACRGSAQGNG